MKIFGRLFCRTSLLALIAYTPFPAASQAQSWFTYDASQGTLPEAQGFDYYSDAAQPAPTVADSILKQGPTSAYGYQYWQSFSQPVNFSQEFTVEWYGRILGSGYGNDASSHRRCGCSFRAIDSSLHIFGVGVAENGVFVWNDDAGWTGSPFINFNMTADFVNLRLHVVNGSASLSINGNLVTNVPLGLPDNGFKGYENQVYFGDGTHAFGSQSQLRFFRFTATPFVGADITRALQIAAGLGPAATIQEAERYNVVFSGSSAGKVDVADAALIAYKVSIGPNP